MSFSGQRLEKGEQRMEIGGRPAVGGWEEESCGGGGGKRERERALGHMAVLNQFC